MNTKIISVKGIAILAFIGMAAANKPLSSGAPSASTGAPLEQTCGMSTCHDDNAINDGPAILGLDLPQNIKAGELVPITIHIKDDSKVRFGFEVTVLDESNKKAGRLILKDTLRTQIIGSKSGLPGREYLTYTYYGTGADKAGFTSWQAYWEAPQTPGKVTFYLAGVSANNDGEDKGDKVYTMQKDVTIQPALSSKSISNQNISLRQINQTLQIDNPNLLFIRAISVTDLNGKEISSMKINLNDRNIKSELESNISGLVIITLQTVKGNISKRLFIHD